MRFSSQHPACNNLIQMYADSVRCSLLLQLSQAAAAAAAARAPKQQRLRHDTQSTQTTRADFQRVATAQRQREQSHPYSQCIYIETDRERRTRSCTCGGCRCCCCCCTTSESRVWQPAREWCRVSSVSCSAHLCAQRRALLNARVLGACVCCVAKHSGGHNLYSHSRVPRPHRAPHISRWSLRSRSSGGSVCWVVVTDVDTINGAFRRAGSSGMHASVCVFAVCWCTAIYMVAKRFMGCNRRRSRRHRRLRQRATNCAPQNCTHNIAQIPRTRLALAA